MMDDMFSSSKGAGIIGMVIALMVFAAFIGLGVAVFDGRYNGDNARSIESKLTQQEAEILFLKEQATGLDKDLEKKRKDHTLRSQADVIIDRLKRLADTREGIESSLAEMRAGVEAVQTAKSTYRQSYRDAVRAKAVGTVIEELKTLDGKIYKSVKIRKVTALELNFMDKTGPKGVPYRDLPPEMQDYYQFGDEEAKAIRSERAAIRKEMTDRLQTVDDQKRDKKKKWEDEKMAEERIQTEQQIAALQRKINDAEAHIQQELGKASNARRLHDAARLRGNSSAHLVTAKKAEEAAARWRKAIEEARRLIEIERKKLQ